MAAHDAAMIRSSMLPDVRVYSARDDGAVAPGTAVGDFADRIAAIKESIVERFTERPSVLINGRIAQVWGTVDPEHRLLGHSAQVAGSPATILTKVHSSRAVAGFRQPWFESG